MTRVAVIGAGAAGTMAALHLLRRNDSRQLHLTVIDPDAKTGPGVPYRTTDPRHLLNVPAERLGVDSDEPLGFVAWLQDNGQTDTGPGDFVPRGLFGHYLSHTFERARGDRVSRVHHRAVAVTRGGDGLSVALGNGDIAHVDAVILAAGPNMPGASWAPSSLRDSALFIRDPWRQDALEDLTDDGDLLLVGTGLTMVDLARTLRRPGRVLHAISRSGLLPRAHRVFPAAPPPTFAMDRGKVLERSVRYIHDVTAQSGDACAAVDALRPHAAELWARMIADERAVFLRKYRRQWDIHRHRMPPQSAAQIERDVAAGALRIYRAALADTSASGGEVRATLSTGQVLEVGAVINCTGPRYDIAASADPLWSQLLDDGLVRPGPLNLGLDTDPSGRLLPGHIPMWTLGPLRRGNLWETTAFAEIRLQAEALAALIGS
ncbi:FAD/NAD(P)-binding protein [Mycobacteroides abscessus]|uniref:FAD/NAD(P)-binding protein n=1 Tax=Mycobacteroides abscessus TaxID=36809 RepID=UPI000992C558|nr:FAD/NAD(P)-binding protein [Mycobacteroides abscessus]ORA30672.1 lycopene cyclase [Mycobacteroides abscessus subsp. bolletii]